MFAGARREMGAYWLGEGGGGRRGRGYSRTRDLLNSAVSECPPVFPGTRIQTRFLRLQRPWTECITRARLADHYSDILCIYSSPVFLLLFAVVTAAAAAATVRAMAVCIGSNE